MKEEELFELINAVLSDWNEPYNASLGPNREVIFETIDGELVVFHPSFDEALRLEVAKRIQERILLNWPKL